MAAWPKIARSAHAHTGAGLQDAYFKSPNVGPILDVNMLAGVSQVASSCFL